VRGDLDVESAPQFRELIQGIASRERFRTILDLKDCTFIDSAGFSAIFDLVGSARNERGCVAAAGPSPRILRIIQLVRLTDERGFQVFSDVESAIVGLSD
jgi:anti-anti-sigma factor